MYFDKTFLNEIYKEASKGQDKTSFLKSKCKDLMKLWLNDPTSWGYYKLVGPYWENLRSILEKYAPEEFGQLRKFAGPFDFENEVVKKEYDQGSEELNFIAALQYLELRENAGNYKDDAHYITIEDQEDIPYIPNQNIDINQYLGRE